MNGFTRIGNITPKLVEESIAAGLEHLTEDQIEDLIQQSLLSTYARECSPRATHERALDLSDQF